MIFTFTASLYIGKDRKNQTKDIGLQTGNNQDRNHAPNTSPREETKKKGMYKK